MSHEDDHERALYPHPAWENRASEPHRYGATITAIAFALASAAASRFLGGGLKEIAASALIGLIIGLPLLLIAALLTRALRPRKHAPLLPRMSR